MIAPHGGRRRRRLAVCESRDRRGLYARARAGQLLEFTGAMTAPAEAAAILRHLARQGYLSPG